MAVRVLSYFVTSRKATRARKHGRSEVEANTIPWNGERAIFEER